MAGDAFTLERKPVGSVPFAQEEPPVILKAAMQKIDWGLEERYETVCAKVPRSTVPLGEKENVSLIPYGCTRLRMTLFPYLE